MCDPLTGTMQKSGTEGEDFVFVCVFFFCSVIFSSCFYKMRGYLYVVTTAVYLFIYILFYNQSFGSFFLLRIRISKASEFFKAALPCMTSSMDKASTFYMTTCYVSFLRNALHQRDPSILENLKKVNIRSLNSNMSSLVHTCEASASAGKRKDVHTEKFVKQAANARRSFFLFLAFVLVYVLLHDIFSLNILVFTLALASQV